MRNTIDRTKQGLRIRMGRKVKGFTLDELAQAVSEYTERPISRQVIWQVEGGNRGVTNEEIYALSAILNQPVSWLEGRTDDDFNTDAMGVYVSSFAGVAA